MSKNFELLQKIGNYEELFDASAEFTGGPSGIGVQGDAEVDQSERDRILEGASLPNVLSVTMDVPSVATPVVDQPGAGNDNGNHEFPSHHQVRRQESYGATAFRSSRNALDAVDAPESAVQSQRFDGAGQGSRLRLDLAETMAATSAAVSLPGVVPEVSPGFESEQPRKAAARNAAGSWWIEAVRTAAKEWRRASRPRGTAYRADSETIARAEEIKLVQLVFPEAAQNAPRVALFSRLDDGAGCAAISARTAEILAARGEGPVCVVDADFLSPSLHHYFGVENGRGFAEATLEPSPIHAFVKQIPEPDLWLLPAGKTSTELSFHEIADGLRVRIDELRGAFRYVVIHGARLRLEGGAMLMSRWTDGVVLILEANTTPRDSAKRAKEILQAAKVSLLGVVLNNRTFPIPEAIYRRL
jgi:Mrp family chromosome partitioning ATPase